MHLSVWRSSHVLTHLTQKLRTNQYTYHIHEGLGTQRSQETYPRSPTGKWQSWNLNPGDSGSWAYLLTSTLPGKSWFLSPPRSSLSHVWSQLSFVPDTPRVFATICRLLDMLVTPLFLLKWESKSIAQWSRWAPPGWRGLLFLSSNCVRLEDLRFLSLPRSCTTILSLWPAQTPRSFSHGYLPTQGFFVLFLSNWFFEPKCRTLHLTILDSICILTCSSSEILGLLCN